MLEIAAACHQCLKNYNFFLEMSAKRLSVKIKAFINKWVCYEFLALHSPLDSWGAFI